MLGYTDVPFDAFERPEHCRVVYNGAAIKADGQQLFYTVYDFSSKATDRECTVILYPTANPPLAECSCRYHANTDNLCNHLLAAICHLEESTGDSPEVKKEQFSPGYWHIEEKPASPAADQRTYVRILSKAAPNSEMLYEATRKATNPLEAARRLIRMRHNWNNPDWRETQGAADFVQPQGEK